MNRSLICFFSFALGSTLFGACVQETTSLPKPTKHTETEDPGTSIGDDPEKPGTKPEDTVGGEDNTYDHGTIGEGEVAEDPYTIAQRREDEGAPETRARLHSCQKLPISTLRNMLVAFGVDMDRTSNPPSAGQLLNGGGVALGQANYAARQGEDIFWTAAGAAKLFDIFVQAAPEIIAAMPTLPQCTVNGVGVEMFAADNTCNLEAISCLIGKPATEDHRAICSNLVVSASSIDKGKNIAVAALLSAAHSCE